MLNNSFELEVAGNAMEPVLIEGDEIAVDIKLNPRTNGKDLAVIEVDGNYHICRLARFGRQLLMLHDNGPTVAIGEDRVKIIGKVVGATNYSINENNHSAANTMAIA
ncbi:S24 family peptidase [Pseudogracilibacillus auburnensis]|uniref:S24 family peptidase n=1 Tax=Pseudogracilibacillus auburnensis TaxID=1494959 RepID=UPI001A959C95|nr:S24 family peptidase [Pseudogracilibacillus auburnensis]MBO1005762.1 S24 family peptidase [Pseudogracilibacillus auburnensis]